MRTLTDLPDELLIHIFAYEAYDIESGHRNYIDSFLARQRITRRLRNLAQQAFFETYIHTVELAFTWWTSCCEDRHGASGTLQDFYSPRVSLHDLSDHLREQTTFVSQIQNLRIRVDVKDPRHVNTAMHEMLKEIRRHPKLKKVNVLELMDVFNPVEKPLGLKVELESAKMVEREAGAEVKVLFSSIDDEKKNILMLGRGNGK